MSLSIRIENIWFTAEAVCHNCLRPTNNDGNDPRFNLDQIEESGWPICPECGFDLHVERFAEVDGISV